MNVEQAMPSIGGSSAKIKAYSTRRPLIVEITNELTP